MYRETEREREREKEIEFKVVFRVDRPTYDWEWSLGGAGRFASLSNVLAVCYVSEYAVEYSP